MRARHRASSWGPAAVWAASPTHRCARRRRAAGGGGGGARAAGARGRRARSSRHAPRRRGAAARGPGQERASAHTCPPAPAPPPPPRRAMRSRPTSGRRATLRAWSSSCMARVRRGGGTGPLGDWAARRRRCRCPRPARRGRRHAAPAETQPPTSPTPPHPEPTTLRPTTPPPTPSRRLPGLRVLPQRGARQGAAQAVQRVVDPGAQRRGVQRGGCAWGAAHGVGRGEPVQRLSLPRALSLPWLPAARA
jgi:hypothetical protein